MSEVEADLEEAVNQVKKTGPPQFLTREIEGVNRQILTALLLTIES